MHPLRKRRLIGLLGLLILLALVSALVLYALRQNISLFYTPTQLKAGEALLNHPIRVGGMVLKGSIQRKPGSKQVSFVVTDFKQQIRVTYQGVLPTLFREGQGVVVNGQLKTTDWLIAEEVLAKHDANYMPPELNGLLKRENHVG